MQNIASLPSSDSKLTEEYKRYGKILQRELNVQKYPSIPDNEIWEDKGKGEDEISQKHEKKTL